MFIVANNQGFNKPIELSDDEEKHLLKVMRLKKGDVVVLTDNEGLLARCLIKNQSPLEFEILEKIKTPRPALITVALPLIDRDRLEWATEKLCELNIQTLQLLVTERTQTQELSESKLNRLLKIAVTAQKQSQRAWPMIILKPQNLKDLVIQAQKNSTPLFFGDWQSQKVEKIALDQEKILIVGPEGGLTTQEVDFLKKSGATSLHLDGNILRTETAAVCLTTILRTIL